MARILAMSGGIAKRLLRRAALSAPPLSLAEQRAAFGWRQAAPPCPTSRITTKRAPEP